MAYLELQSGENSGERYMLDGERAILGRHPDCDIVLDVGAISRQHAQILKIDGELCRRGPAKPQRHVRQRRGGRRPAHRSKTTTG